MNAKTLSTALLSLTLVASIAPLAGCSASTTHAGGPVASVRRDAPVALDRRTTRTASYSDGRFARR